LVGKPEGKRPPGRPRRRWENGIRMDLREIGLGGVDCIRLVQGRDRWRAVVNTMMNLPVLAPRSCCSSRRRYLPISLRGVATQNNDVIFTAMTTSDLTVTR
jgi:hypothetical protein